MCTFIRAYSFQSCTSHQLYTNLNLDFDLAHFRAEITTCTQIKTMPQPLVSDRLVVAKTETVIAPLTMTMGHHAQPPLPYHGRGFCQCLSFLPRQTRVKNTTINQEGRGIQKASVSCLFTALPYLRLHTPSHFLSLALFYLVRRFRQGHLGNTTVVVRSVGHYRGVQ